MPCEDLRYRYGESYYGNTEAYVCDPNNMCNCGEGFIENENGRCVEGEHISALVFESNHKLRKTSKRL